MSDIRFDDQVVIVTGAGGGLGRTYALDLARRGAKVVVNDLGGTVSGDGASQSAAEAVVAEIAALGGEAIADAGSVTDAAAMAAMADKALSRWGRIDVLIANAGVLRDKTFAKMEIEDFRFVLDVHLMGAVNAVKAVWESMRARNYGRIVLTTSSSGLYGHFGQSNYGAAKMGLVGLMNTLKLEGAKNEIRVNAISPVAATRMTEGLIPEQILARLKPEQVAAAVVMLASQDAPSGAIVSAGAGAFALARVTETDGVFLGADATAEDVRAAWTEICNPSGQEAYFQGAEQTQKLLKRASGV